MSGNSNAYKLVKFTFLESLNLARAFIWLFSKKKGRKWQMLKTW